MSHHCHIGMFIHIGCVRDVTLYRNAVTHTTLLFPQKKKKKIYIYI